MRTFWNRWIATPRGSRRTGLRRHRLGMEILEDRAVPAGIGWDNATGVITIEGSTSVFSDKVQISPYDDDFVKVTLSQFNYNFATMTGSWVKLAEQTFVEDAVQKVVYHGYEGSDTFINNTHVASYADGGVGNDTLEGGSGADILVGSAGADTLDGNGGNDTLWGYGFYLYGSSPGPDGDNTIHGGWGDDLIYGGSTNETIFGDSGNDKVYAGSGDDKVKGGSGADELYGQGGNDTVYGESDNDKLFGGDGSDTLHGGTLELGYSAGDSAADGNDTLDGEGGVDAVYGGGGNDLLHGGSAVDFLFGGDGADLLYGDDGDDSFFGGNGGDDLYGGAGDDLLNGEAGGDSLNGGDGHDTLKGGSDNDFLHGNDGNDRLFGEGGSDWLSGGNGNDWLEAGTAAESAFGGSGTDFNAHKWAINGTERDDIDQGAAPTCWLMAALSSVAGTGYLSSRIEYLGNYVYRVELLVNVAGIVVSTFEDVTFNGTVLSQDADPRSQGSAGLEESWVVLFQRAWLQRMGIDWSDADAIPGGSPAGILTALTGRVSSSYGAGIISGLTFFDLVNIQVALAAGKNVCACTWASDVKSLSTGLLVPWHCYTVISANSSEVVLRNPWATDGGTAVGDTTDGYVTVSWSDFSKSMSGYVIN
jgi:Ca2+-binding RTX toxin-like protein